MIAGCEQGRRDDWRSFIAAYTPVAFGLLDVYFGRALPGAEREALWKEILSSLAVRHAEVLRGFEHQAEREFLSDFRIYFLQRARLRLEPPAGETVPASLAPESVRVLLEGLPLLHQEIVFFKLTGYSDATIESLLRISPVVAKQGVERLRADCGAALQRERDEGIWPGAWLDVLQYAWSGKTEACAPLRQFIRIHDGQTSWADKEPVEQHVARCLHCLERWTALREIEHLRNRASPSARTDDEALLSGLPLSDGDNKPGKARYRSFMRRMFG